MAVVKTILKVSDNEAVVKVAGISGSATVNLATDLLGVNEVVDGSEQFVSIAGVQWSGDTDGVIKISRDGTNVIILQTSSPGQFDMLGQMLTPDTTNATKNVVVTISGAECQCWVRLKKVSGYKSKIEYAEFGSYDDPTQAGA